MPEKLEKIPRLKTDNRWSFETTVFSNQLQLDTINNPDLPMTNLILWKVHLPQIKDILMEDPETVSGSSDPVAISFPVLYTRTLLFIHSRWSEVKWNCSVVSDSLHSPWMDCVLWGPSIHGILQARILEWVAISFSRGSSWPRIEPGSPALQTDAFTVWATRESLIAVNPNFPFRPSSNPSPLGNHKSVRYVCESFLFHR